MNRIDQLAALQKKYMDEAMFLENRAKVHETWFDVTTTDYWRHKRMYETVAPFARAFKIGEQARISAAVRRGK
jgi:hypothetical protein